MASTDRRHTPEVSLADALIERLRDSMTYPECWLAHPGRPCARTAPGGYCPPRQCYCGECPWWTPDPGPRPSDAILLRPRRRRWERRR